MKPKVQLVVCADDGRDQEIVQRSCLKPYPRRSIWSIARIVLAPRLGYGAEYTHSTSTRCEREAFHGIARRAQAHFPSWLWFSA